MTLSFYAVTWKDKTASLKVTINGGGTIDGGSSKSFSLTGNPGAIGNPPYTLTLITIVGTNRTVRFETVAPGAESPWHEEAGLLEISLIFENKTPIKSKAECLITQEFVIRHSALPFNYGFIFALWLYF